VAGPSHSLTTLDFWPPFVKRSARNLFDKRINCHASAAATSLLVAAIGACAQIVDWGEYIATPPRAKRFDNCKASRYTL